MAQEVDGRQEVEIGYRLLPAYWGAGLANEASRVALSWVFSLGSKSVEAFIEPANTRSIRLLERLGFERSHEATGELARYVGSAGCVA